MQSEVRDECTKYPSGSGSTDEALAGLFMSNSIFGR
jgi:hypothetical protein